MENKYRKELEQKVYSGRVGRHHDDDLVMSELLNAWHYEEKRAAELSSWVMELVAWPFPEMSEEDIKWLFGIEIEYRMRKAEAVKTIARRAREKDERIMQ